MPAQTYFISQNSAALRAALATDIPALYSGTSSATANPTAKVGTSAVNGVASTYMRSDAAPPIDLTISYSWTAKHTWTAPATSPAVVVNGDVGVTSFTGNTPLGLQVGGSNGTTDYSGIDFLGSGAIHARIAVLSTGGGSRMFFGTSNNYGTGVTNNGMEIDENGSILLTGKFALNGNAAPAQVTGWGTPTGPAVVANFSGTAATLVQCSNAIAKIITDLKALGLYAA